MMMMGFLFQTLSSLWEPPHPLGLLGWPWLGVVASHRHSFVGVEKKTCFIPMGSMGLEYLPTFGSNVGKYSIHAAYGENNIFGDIL